MKSFDTVPLKGLASVPGTILNLTLNAPAAETTDEILAPRSVPSHGFHSGTGPDNCHCCNDFYKRYVDIHLDAQVRLAKGTVEQRGSVWEGSRKVRITASVTSKIPKRKHTLPERALASLLRSSFRGNKATMHGTQCEPIAREAFEQETGLKVARLGTVVSQSEPYLSASPDGLAGTDSILEIKCPYTEDCSSLLDSGKYDVRKGDDGYFLSKSGRGATTVKYNSLCIVAKGNIAFLCVDKQANCPG